MALAGLSVKDKGEKNEETLPWEGTISAETYDRSLGGYFKSQPSKRSVRGTKQRNRSGYRNDSSRGSKLRPNVIIGTRPKADRRGYGNEFSEGE